MASAKKPDTEPADEQAATPAAKDDPGYGFKPQVALSPMPGVTMSELEDLVAWEDEMSAADPNFKRSPAVLKAAEEAGL